MSVKKSLILLLIILVTVLQCTILNRIRIFNVKPDILLSLVVFFSLYYGRSYALAVGAFCGVLAEATCGLPSGYVIFAYSLGGLILGHLARWINKQTAFSEIAISFIFSFVIYSFLSVVLLQNFNTDLSLFKALIFIVFPASFYTALCAPITFRFLKTVLSIS
ncbi:MAG: hypothetical protein NG712_05420 [Omnitrophica bacterium]|nr:hypothetical protein [Candidatus Omnitrophota bacterium]